MESTVIRQYCGCNIVHSNIFHLYCSVSALIWGISGAQYHHVCQQAPLTPPPSELMLRLHIFLVCIGVASFIRKLVCFANKSSWFLYCYIFYYRSLWCSGQRTVAESTWQALRSSDWSTGANTRVLWLLTEDFHLSTISQISELPAYEGSQRLQVKRQRFVWVYSTSSWAVCVRYGMTKLAAECSTHKQYAKLQNARSQTISIKKHENPCIY